jgi:DNA polymerase III epsilon subunit-like protein
MYWVVLILSATAAFVLARYLIKPRVDAWRRRRALPPRFVTIALQSTGASPVRHEVLGIAAVRVTPGTADHPFIQGLIRPPRPLPRRALDAAGVTQEALERDGKPAADVIRAFAEFAGNDRLVFHNASAQLALLRALAERHGVSLGNPVSDTQDMARRAWPARPNHKLGELARACGAQPPARNSPLNDCAMIATVYAEAAARLKRFD